ncbi:glycosyltransferase family 4 protein [Candidatus Kaiserbacteria bacterium]|nr:glycosyltransferase family 4 protein [Candidatus Kaiserbacteria bacterium]
MKLLIITQAVDLDDPVLAFFHGWIEKFASRFEHVHVICLKEGRHALPSNVKVHSLGKENGESNIKYIRRFLTYVWALRKEYDTVFVHMNPEYIVLGGWLWKLIRKPVTLWYIHPKSSWRLWIARIFATHIVSATEKSFPLRSQKLIPIGLGVDTDFFNPGEVPSGDDFKVMLAARIAPVKRVECVIGAVSELMRRNVPVVFDYYGGALRRDKTYADTMYKLVPAATPPDMWRWHGDSSQTQVRDAYRAHDAHVNATDSGSFDKAVFESMACGCITVVSNRALRGVVPDELMFEEGDSVSLADVLERVYRLSCSERSELKKKIRAIAEEKYSLSALIGRVVEVLKS